MLSKKIAKLIRDPNHFFEDYFAKRRRRARARKLERLKRAQGPTGPIVELPRAYVVDEPEPQLPELLEKTVVYESFHGRSMSCNPYAIFLQLQRDPRFAGFQHVWILQRPEEFAGRETTFAGFGEVQWVKRGSKAHKRLLGTAKYLINNSTFPPEFTKRPGQVYVNTQHGVPIKAMGNDIRDEFGTIGNVARNLLLADFLVMPNRYTTEIMLRSHGIENLFTGHVVEAGYPRTDVIRQGEDEKASLRARLSIEPGKKVVLYAPTYRGAFNAARERDEMVVEFLRELKERYADTIVLLDKSHYSNTLARARERSVLDDIDSNELLSIVDVLITDYSSIAFDFFAQRLPVIYFAYDLVEYKVMRGLYLDPAQLPGVTCTTADEVFTELDQLDTFFERHGQAYQAAIDTYCAHEDGRASARVIEAVFFGDTEYLAAPLGERRCKILLYGGTFLNNGVTSSVAALLKVLDQRGYDIYLAFDPRTSAENIARLKSRVPARTKLLFYVARGGKKNRNPYLHGKYEARRLFGSAEFDVAMDASGYGAYWPSVIACVNASRHLIFLHNCMMSERETRPHVANFDVLFELYQKKYDSLITVSQSSYDANAEHLPHVAEKMFCLENFLDHDRILSLAMENDVDKSCTNFINIGRYTYQKGQDRLIEAFARLQRHYPNTRLYLVGYGEDHQKLITLVSQFGLGDKVIFTGKLENPFRLMKQCDCFVMSSRYEGQGIVLLESLVLGVPAISTDIAGPRSVLAPECLYDDSADGLLRGMTDFMEGTVPLTPFDAAQYNEKSARQLEALLGEQPCKVNAQLPSTQPDGNASQPPEQLSGQATI